MDHVLHIGTAGFAIPGAAAGRFSGEGSHLARYAAQLSAVEINSSFYRPHRRTTYARWAASVPEDFRFAVKLPKAITHERRLQGCADLVARFADEVGGLGAKRGPVLVQLPPSLAFDAAVAEPVLADLVARLGLPIACEPRHPGWFAAKADRLLLDLGIARVAADPAPVPAAAHCGGATDLAYVRLHGSPTMYWSAYGAERVAVHARETAALARRAAAVYVIYDNTAAGAAIEDALALAARLRPMP